MIFIFAIFACAASVVWANGTVRIYTGKGTWYYKNCNELAVDCPGAPFVPAVNVVHWADGTPPDNPWDRPVPPLVPTNQGPPRPWEKLYSQCLPDSAFWIGMNNNGQDITLPNNRDTLWFYSPDFQLYSNISRATIWLSADDVIDMALLRDLTVGTAYAMPCVPVDSFGNFFRFDLTDFFRSIPPSGQGFRMEFRVRNTAASFVGVIGYMSNDYGTARNYSYILSGGGYRYVSMPFKPSNSSATLQSLFPGIVSAAYYNWQTGSWEGLPITSPLTGSLGGGHHKNLYYTASLFNWRQPQYHNFGISYF